MITQSAVSMMIKELEKEVGAQLVHRGKVAQLTPAGEALRLSGQRAMDEVDQAVAAIRGGGQLKTGLLRLAVGHLTAATLFPKALKLFKQRQPHIAVEVLDGPVEQGSRLVIGEEVDAAIGSVDSHPSRMALLYAEELMRDPLCVVSSRHFDIVTRARNKISWDEIGQTEVILIDRIYGQWRSLFLEVAKKGIDLRVAYDVKLYSTAVEMVRNGLGVVLLPSFVAKRLDPDEFRTMLLGDSPGDWVIHWVEKRNIPRAPGLAELKGALQETLSGIQ